MKRNYVVLALAILMTSFGFSQTKEELEDKKAEYQAEVDKHQAEVEWIQGIMDDLPGWRVNFFTKWRKNTNSKQRNRRGK